MMLSDIRLGLENILPDANQKTVQVVSARPETDKDSVIKCWRLEILTRRGSRNPVKFPLSEENKRLTEQVAELLKKNDTVSVILKNEIIRPYAMISAGNLISGVSVKADSFEIVESDDDLLG